MATGFCRHSLEEARSELVHRGAEAELYLLNWRDNKAVLKIRTPKPYRSPKLDFSVRAGRFLKEVKFLANCKRLGVPVPAVLWSDRQSSSICMEFIQGDLVRTMMLSGKEENLDRVWTNIGSIVGRLHLGGIVHGDLTTSNMILNQDFKVFLIDLGMAAQTRDVEDRAVDLHLLEQALQSTHYYEAEQCWGSFWDSYRKVLGHESGEVMKRLLQVRRRGRYFASR